MKTYSATVKVRMSGSNSMMLVKTHVQADCPDRAKWLLEAQYGRGNVIGTPQQVK